MKKHGTIKLYFNLNPKLDTHLTEQFLFDFSEAGGFDFRELVLRDHPTLKEVKRNNKNKIEKYIEDFYNDKSADFNDSISRFGRGWNKIARDFFEATYHTFNGFTFNSEPIVCYISALSMGPRFIDERFFCVYYKDSDYKGTIAHELMHFLFFEYSASHFGSLVSSLDKNTGYWWRASEVFNNVILSSDTYRFILGTKEDEPYPDHKELFLEALGVYEDNKDTDRLITFLLSRK